MFFYNSALKYLILRKMASFGKKGPDAMKVTQPISVSSLIDVEELLGEVDADSLVAPVPEVLSQDNLPAVGEDEHDSWMFHDVSDSEMETLRQENIGDMLDVLRGAGLFDGEGENELDVLLLTDVVDEEPEVKKGPVDAVGLFGDLDLGLVEVGAQPVSFEMKDLDVDGEQEPRQETSWRKFVAGLKRLFRRK